MQEQKHPFKQLFKYYILCELLSLEQQNFKPNSKKVIPLKYFIKLINNCKLTKDEKPNKVYKIYLGKTNLKSFLEYLQEINFIQLDEKFLETKGVGGYFTLGYFYLTRMGQLIGMGDNVIKFMPILMLLKIFNRTKSLEESVSRFVDTLDDATKSLNIDFEKRWFIETENPTLCYIFDTSAILSNTFDPHILPKLNNCSIVVPTHVLAEVDYMKKHGKPYQQKKAFEFRAIFDQMIQKAEGDSLESGLLFTSPDEEKNKILIKSFHGDINDSEKDRFGVDSLADVSVIKATLHSLKNHFPVLVTTDRSITIGIRTVTNCFLHTERIDKTFRIYPRKLGLNVSSRKATEIQELEQEENFLFEYFELSELLPKLRDTLNLSQSYRHKGTSVHVEEVSYHEMMEDLKQNYINSVLKDLNHLANNYHQGGSSVLENYIQRRKTLTDLASVKGVVSCFIQQDIPLAKWFAPYGASMLQQIAINYISSLPEQDIIAVNGPPGTGKTTLLKDVIANIIVKKALKIIDVDYDIFKEARLVPELHGHGVVVVSNNNAAVENISIELPQLDNDVKAALNNIERDGFRYFKEIILKYFEDKEETDDDKDDEQNESDIENKQKRDYLGLFSIPLGNSTNRNKFHSLISVINDHLYEQPEVEMNEIRKTGQKIKQYEQEISYLSENHKRYYQLILLYQELSRKVDELNKKLIKAENSLNEKRQALNLCEKEIDDLTKAVADKEKHYKMVLESKPSVFIEIFSVLIKSYRERIQEWQDHAKKLLEDLEKHRKERENLINGKNMLRKDIESLLDEIKKLKNIIAKKQEKGRAIRKNIEDIKNTLGDGAVLDEEDFLKFMESDENSLDQKDREKIYKFAPYNSEKLNRLRLKILVESIKLQKLLIIKHRDIITDKLRELIKYLSQPEKYSNKENIVKELFETFFFFIPVTSTTFASFSRMFEAMPKAGIGYLLIDEAGQALPHYAFMPVHKSNRVIAVGDPDQIEPVIVLPSKLDTAIANIYNISNEYLLTENSVQTFTDRASEVAAVYERKKVGIPLNIHRRCNDPMFSIVNKVIYNKRMIKTTKDRHTIELPEPFNKSMWIHVDYYRSENRDGVVFDEVKALRDMLKAFNEYFLQQGFDIIKLVKDKSFFIITPFVAVKKHLLKELREGCILEQELANEGKAKYIGTIHTFQGKEAKVVIIILGGRTERSMAWVAKKPNMLNVALTRAKERCFIIGDKHNWNKLPYFRETIRELPIIDSFHPISIDTNPKNHTLN